MKKFLSILIMVLFLFNNLECYADILRGSVMETVEQPLPTQTFTGEYKKIDEKQVIELTVDKVIDTNFSIEGDEFFAKVTNDVGKNGVVLPKGTVAHGVIYQTKEAKRLGRNGSISLNFDYLITPDGRKIPIEGGMSTKLNPVKEFGKIVATDVGYTTVGGLVGGWYALNLFGLEAAIASQGYTVAGGAAIGGTVGLAMSLWRKGKNALITPGDQIKIKLKTAVTLPVYKDEALLQEEMKYDGFNVEITNVQYEKDPFGEPNTITLTLKIENLSDKTFSGMDITLSNEFNQVFYPSVFGNTNLMFEQIKVGDRLIGKISFSVHDVKGTYWLTFKDRLTKKELVKVSIDNAYKGVSNRTKRKNERVSKKKANLYRTRDYEDYTE
ncbi:TPA: hypothetical protein CPT80_07015 [Candidatus Gastranaerophilales bacterium HUM_9]|nr:MAG TPA: hypothetical protein CPT80_07015 [Candidatus Gastranaerophilales bacterium HUM_9]HBX35258.1 hypothetical protein [Cyanobacteria bacterium UBA11440]